jgi:spermidine synthase
VKDPKDVLVVACGAGVTAGTFLLHPGIEHVTICDIEPLVPTMVTPMFTKENYGIVDHIKERNPDTVHGKTVQVVYDDGRHFIRTTQEKYDIISSDPIDPWVKGCAAMNTVEYYQMCKDHLKPGGVMTLWIPFYESNIPTIKSVITTFFKVFPNGVLFSNDFNGAGYDAVLFGQVGPDPAKPDEPVQLDLDAAQARLDSAPYAEVKQSLSEYTFGTAADVYGTYAGRAHDMSEWMDANLINTDRDLRLQYLAGLALNNYNATNLLTDITRYYKYPDDLFTGTVAHKLALKQAIEIPRHLNMPAVSSLTNPMPPAGP